MTTATMPIGISWSEILMWIRCPRKWFVTYFLGYLPANESPVGSRNIGSRWALAMEAYYGHQIDPGFVLDVLYGLAIEEHGDYERQLRADHELSKIMMNGYLDWVKSEGTDAGLQVAEAEAEVRMPLPGWEGIVDLRARLDRVVFDQSTGLFSFIDDKTADSFERHDMLEVDGQMLTYSLIAWLATQGSVPMLGAAPEIREGVPLVNGGIIRTARRVKRTKTSRPPYYDEHRFRHSPERLAAHLLTTQKIVSEIMDARQQLQAAYDRGGLIEQIHFIQLTTTRPTKIIHDCSRMCPLSKGLCQMMDDGTGWMDALVRGGAYVQGDPYERYSRGGLDAVKARIMATNG